MILMLLLCSLSIYLYYPFFFILISIRICLYVLTSRYLSSILSFGALPVASILIFHRAVTGFMIFAVALRVFTFSWERLGEGVENSSRW